MIKFTIITCTYNAAEVISLRSTAYSTKRGRQ